LEEISWAQSMLPPLLQSHTGPPQLPVSSGFRINKDRSLAMISHMHVSCTSKLNYRWGASWSKTSCDSLLKIRLISSFHASCDLKTLRHHGYGKVITSICCVWQVVGTFKLKARRQCEAHDVSTINQKLGTGSRTRVHVTP
jgi:hypothetical protein